MCNGNYQLLERIRVLSEETGLAPFSAPFEPEPLTPVSALEALWPSFLPWPSFLNSVLPVKTPETTRERPKTEYVLKNKFGRGGFGEVWLAVRTGTSELFVIKRLLVEKGEHIKQSGFREIHFGYLLRHQSHVARYVEFYEESGQLWLVFHYEGISLENYLYHRNLDPSTQLTTLTPSKEWKALKADLAGEGSRMRDLVFQLLEGVAQVHEMGVVNRDIKPSNILLKFPTVPSKEAEEPRESREQLVAVRQLSPADEQVTVWTDSQAKAEAVSEGALPSPAPLKGDPEANPGLGGHLRLADFGSGIDVEDPLRLYAGMKPSKEDSSLGYAPPEVLFGAEPYEEPKPYDLWSVGVVLLEVVLGSPEVFRLDGRTRAKLEAKLSPDVSPETRKQALLLGAFMELCLHENTEQFPTGMEVSVVRSCNETQFDQELKRWDPLGQGTNNIWLTRLIRGLLQWRPGLRVTAKTALSHAYFQGPYVCPVCGKEHEFEFQLAEHSHVHSEP